MAKSDVSVTPDTEQAAMMTGLFSRDGRYSGKVVVPVDLRSSYGGKKVIVRALGTADYAEAKRLNLAFRLEMDAAFGAKRAELKSTLQHGPAPASGYWDTMSREQFEYEMERMAYFSAEDAREEHEYDQRQAVRSRYEALSAAPLDALSQDERALRDVLDDLRFDAELANSRLAYAKAQNVAHDAPTTTPLKAVSDRAVPEAYRLAGVPYSDAQTSANEGRRRFVAAREAARPDALPTTGAANPG